MANRRLEPRGKEDIRCATVAELDATKIEWINGAVLSALTMLKLRAAPEEAEVAFTPPVLRDYLKRIAVSNEIRTAPFVAALSTENNPALLFKRPASMSLDEITDFRLNPDYIKPEWLVRRIERIAAAERKKA